MSYVNNMWAKFTSAFAFLSTPNCIQRRQVWHECEAPSLYYKSMHIPLRKLTSSTKKIGVNNPTGLAHIAGVASYSEAQPESEDIRSALHNHTF